MERLPQELFDTVFQLCSRKDLLALHQVSRTLAEAVRSHLFQKVQFSLDPRSWANIHSLAADQMLREYIQELVLKPQLLPAFPDKEAWLHCVDVRPFRGRFYHDMLPPEERHKWPKAESMSESWLFEAYNAMPLWPENVHEVYLGYLDVLKWQQELVKDPTFLGAFRKLVQSFPRLRSLRETSWNEGWFNPPFIGKDGKYDPVSWYHDMLKPKDVMFKREDLDDEWDDTRVYRASILRARTTASRLFFNAASPSSEETSLLGHNGCRKFSVSISLNGWDIRDRMLDLSDVLEYEHLRKLFFCDLETFQISSLDCLDLSIVYGADFEELMTLFTTLRKLLDTARALTGLSLRVRSGNNDEDMFENFCETRLPSLKTFSLIGATVHPKSLELFLSNHAATLKELVFHEVCLERRTARWSNFLARLPRFMSLEEFDATCLTDGGDRSNDFKSFTGPHSSNLPQLRQYICNGGPWLPLESAIHESGGEETNLVDEVHSGWDWS